MDPIRNPYAPGAGTQPPELAGRDELREQVHITIERVKIGRQAKSLMMIGLRGVGKTVLLDRMRLDAEANGSLCLRMEAPEGRSLPALLAPQVRQVLLRLSHVAAAKDLAQRALAGLAGFAKALKVKYDDLEVGLDFEPEPGLADNGDLESDLQDLLEATGEAAKTANTAVVIFIDELQYVEEHQLGALIMAMHRIAQRNLPLVLVAAGLPQLPGRLGKAKSYAERLFDFPFIGPLNDRESAKAIVNPAREEGVEFDQDAVQLIFTRTQGYPYFLQEWGKHAWDAADSPPITVADIELASQTALAALDAGFFHVRFDRLTPKEKEYLRAMAEIGVGPHRSGDIAEHLGKSVQTLAPLRSNLIGKGMIWSPCHGDTAFTVPLFDQFMKRIMPRFPSS
ncbi:MAG: AAA family ATPase [Verrucomicrobiae bacterium]|nr:AAA family ATPase [Verrucomicrobiae bacterium]NNJ86128.1 AAA family ATPase [Akkermansiaceae bacterium]